MEMIAKNKEFIFRCKPAQRHSSLRAFFSKMLDSMKPKSAQERMAKADALKASADRIVAAAIAQEATAAPHRLIFAQIQYNKAMALLKKTERDPAFQAEARSKWAAACIARGQCSKIMGLDFEAAEYYLKVAEMDAKSLKPGNEFDTSALAAIKEATRRLKELEV